MNTRSRSRTMVNSNMRPVTPELPEYESVRAPVTDVKVEAAMKILAVLDTLDTDATDDDRINVLIDNFKTLTVCQQCTGVTKKGTQCKKPASKSGGSKCWMHVDR